MIQRSVIATVESALRQLPDVNVHYAPPAIDAAEGRFVSPSGLSLHGAMAEYLGRHYPSGLFTHQYQAIENVLQRRNTVVATRTSSGKSLIYSVPIFDFLCREPDSTALLLFPQKALANDQWMSLTRMAAGISPASAALKERPSLISRYDGATPSDSRSAIRRDVQVLLTNPEMLHLAILQHHDRHWDRFLRQLKLIAIDECHEYRGVFGTNVAYILRRLRQLCAGYQSEPTIVATSATVREPQQHLQQLTGMPFVCVGPEHDGSLQGRRQFSMVSTADHHYDAARRLASSLVEAGLTVLAFCPSRVAAERIIARMPKAETAGEKDHIRVYRSGLSSEEREDIEAGLRNRSVRLVFSTSALELGIDIGEIDVVICIGLPHTMMSLWQRAGRAARGGREGAIVFLPADTPIDTYYANKPEELFGRDHEPLVLNLENQRIACQHFACATQEVGGDINRLRLPVLGPEMAAIHKLRASGSLNRDEFYRNSPHMEVSIRGTGDGCYSLNVGEERIGEIDSLHLLRECYRNAIYRHGGQVFRVKEVIRGKNVVRLQRDWSRHETTPVIQTQIRLKQQLATEDYAGVRLAKVSIDVTEFLVAVMERDASGNPVRNWPGSQGMAPRMLPTEGTMLLLKPHVWGQLQSKLGGLALPAWEAAQRLIGGLFPTVSGPCDTQDYSAATEKLPTGEQAIFLYDLVYDGVGLTFSAFANMRELLEKARERVETCVCETDIGCIRCVANPLNSQLTSKSATKDLLSVLRQELRHAPISVSETPDRFAAGLEPRPGTACSTCATIIDATMRFCPNCGAKQEPAP